MTIESSRIIEAIKTGIESRLVDVHTALPCKVKRFDATLQVVDVVPVLKRKFSSTVIETLPVITNVPIVYPQSGDAIISFPIAIGDYVYCVFSERSIDKWLRNGDIVDPADPRKHNLSDAVAIPGLKPFTEKRTRVHSSHMRIENKDASIELQNTGKFKIQNLNGEELMDLLVQLLDELIVATVSTDIGPQGFINVAEFQELKTKFESLKGV